MVVVLVTLATLLAEPSFAQKYREMTCKEKLEFAPHLLISLRDEAYQDLSESEKTGGDLTPLAERFFELKSLYRFTLTLTEIINGPRELDDVSDPEFDLVRDLGESDAFLSKLELVRSNLDDESVVFVGIVSCLRTAFSD